MSVSPGKIPEPAFKSVSGILFGVAMIAAAARSVHRLRDHRRFFADDFLLLFACICLTAATIVFYIASSRGYFEVTGGLLMRPDVFRKNIVWYKRMVFTHIFLTWTVIFAVKFAFLCFFRLLIERLTHMILYWRIVVGVTVVCCGLCVSESAIECPHFDASGAQCIIGPGVKRTLGIMAGITSLDIITDIIMIMIPLRLLWKTNLKLKQKLGLGAFLCLSIFMIITAIVRVSALSTTTDVLGGIRIKTLDVTWRYFWHQVEACVAVSMVSFTAFRSIFIAESSKPRDRRAKPWLSSRQRIRNLRRKDASEEQGRNKLPSIPSATLTGMRTFIRGGPETTMLSFEGQQESSDGRPPPKHGQEV